MKLFAVLCLLSAVIMCSMATKVGGIGETENVPGDDEKAIVAKVATELKSQALATLAGSDGSDKKEEFDKSEIEVLGYKTQVVAGRNYFFKLQIAKMIFHARVYKDLQGNVSVTKVVGPKEKDDELSYIE